MAFSKLATGWLVDSGSRFLLSPLLLRRALFLPLPSRISLGDPVLRGAASNDAYSMLGRKN